MKTEDSVAKQNKLFVALIKIQTRPTWVLSHHSYFLMKKINEFLYLTDIQSK